MSCSEVLIIKNENIRKISYLLTNTYVSKCKLNYHLASSLKIDTNILFNFSLFIKINNSFTLNLRLKLNYAVFFSKTV